MRKTSWAVTIALIACLGSGATAGPAAAEGAVVMRFPFVLADFIPCTGEFVVLTGTWQETLRLGNDANGGFHLVGNWNIHAKGAGDFGNNYRINYTDIWVLNIAADSLPETFNHPWTAVVVGQGTAANLKLHGTIHTTINNNGDVTSSVGKLRITCK